MHPCPILQNRRAGDAHRYCRRRASFVNSSTKIVLGEVVKGQRGIREEVAEYICGKNGEAGGLVSAARRVLAWICAWCGQGSGLLLQGTT